MKLTPFFSFMLFISITQKITSPVYAEAGLDTEIKKCVTNLASSARASIKSFCNKVKSFFSKPFAKIDETRKKIKETFNKMIDESISSNEEVGFTVGANDLNVNRDTVPKMSMLDLTLSHGFQTETHTVLTKDGYIITIFRIFKRPLDSTRTGKRVVLLYHGLWGSAVDWILLGPGKALPYLLLKSGYDVWLANTRGNKYSNDHVTKTTDSIEYWNFSWHEIGVYDISSVIDYVIEVTEGKSEINFIAYSMGATALLVLLSTSPQYNTAIRSVILIAPLVFMYHVKGPIRYLVSEYNVDDLSFLSHYGPNELITGGTFPDHVIEKYCSGSKILCSNPLLLLGNGGKEISNINITASILGHVPAGGSKKTLLHYLQLILSGKFCMFDYGHANAIVYGNKSPLSYELRNITTPINIINSQYDWLSTVEDVGKLIHNIPVINHLTIRRNDFSHFDFLWADDAPRLLYFPILNYLNNVYPTNREALSK